MTGTASPIRRFALTLGWVALLASCGPDPLHVGSTSRAISGGRIDDGDPAVGALIYGEVDGDVGLCTATLIGPMAALTAAHCMVHDGLDADWVDFYLGGTRHPVSGWTIHPEWDAGSRDYGTTAGFDLAVLHFGSAISTALPLLLAEYPPREGHNVRVVGFGITEEADNEVDDSSVKRVVELDIGQVEPHLLWLDGHGLANSCSGDSGGPHLALEGGREVQVGLTSGSTPCGEPDGLTTGPRIDAHREWIEGALTLGAPPSFSENGAVGRPSACTLGSGAPSFPTSMLGLLVALLWLRRRAS